MISHFYNPCRVRAAECSLELRNHSVFTTMLFPNSRSTDQLQLLKTYFYQNLFHFESQAARSRLVISSVFRACHTTRPPYFGEGDRVDYHFISQEVFDEMVNMVRMFPFVPHKKCMFSARNIRN